MRRIKLVLAVAAVMGAILAAFAVPAMADDLNCRDARGNLIRCDHRFFAPVNDFFFSPFFCDDDFDFRFDRDDCFNGFRHHGGIFFGINQEIG